jgi:dihydrofolate reductase
MASSTPEVQKDFVDRMNAIPKYVASTTLTQTIWNASIIKGNIAEEVFKLKQQSGQNILKYGTGILDHLLIEHNLIDFLYIYLYPFVFGHGIRLFEDIRASKHLKLVETTTFKSGTLILKYNCKT